MLLTVRLILCALLVSLTLGCNNREASAPPASPEEKQKMEDMMKKSMQKGKK